MATLKFVDLFAGLGGFHRALTGLGHECVFASEIDDELRELYVLNYPEMKDKTFGDILECQANVPRHDVLCAGFPCQPFSKSGDQLGTSDKSRGTLFHTIIKILNHHQPRYFILENVGNFERHDGGHTWKVVKNSLLGLGYDVRGTEHVNPPPKSDWRDLSSAASQNGVPNSRNRPNGNGRGEHRGQNGRSPVSRDTGHGLISPHHLGYPQNRERFYIVGCRGTLPADPFPVADRTRATSLTSIVQAPRELSSQDRQETALSDQQIRCIEHWNALLRALPPSIELPSFPMWGDEIGARYPYAETTPWAMQPRDLRFCIRGQRFARWTRKTKLLAALPSYARDETARFRDWKIRYIHQNREWFRSIMSYVPEGWVEELMRFPPSLRKLEWNVKGGVRNLWHHVLQFRPSGLRVKRYTSSPALVAMTATQIPILGPERRSLSRIEGLRLQGFPDSHILPASRASAFASLGNAVHVQVVQEVAMRLVRQPMRVRRAKREAPAHTAAGARPRGEHYGQR